MTGLRFQLVIDCLEPHKMVRFWSSALGYDPEPLPPGFRDWIGYYRSMGASEDELAQIRGPEAIVDPQQAGPRVWFQAVEERKQGKNRIHLDLMVGGGRSVPVAERKARVEAEAARLVALGATRIGPIGEGGPEHYGVAMLDPEGNEFDVA